MGVLSYYIAGTQNAGLARKTIKRFIRTLPPGSQQNAESMIQEVYAQTRMSAENTMGASLSPLEDIVAENIAMLQFICSWPENDDLFSALANALFRFYISVSRL